MSELIVYTNDSGACLPSVRPSTFSNNSSSETTDPTMVASLDCETKFSSNGPSHMIKMATILHIWAKPFKSSLQNQSGISWDLVCSIEDVEFK